MKSFHVNISSLLARSESGDRKAGEKRTKKSLLMERNVWKQTTPKPAMDGCVSAFDFHYVPLKCSFFV